MSTLVKILVIWMFLFIGVFHTRAQQRITVKGNSFVTKSGDTLVFRGMSSSDPDKLEEDNRWKKSYFQEMRRWGANIVRFPVHPEAWRKRGKENYLKLLDQGIQWAAESGLYVIMDWHSIGNLRSALFQDPMYDTTLKETYEFWKTIAERYGNNTTVAFYELFNEPTTSNGKLGTCSWEEWKAITEELIVIVRANGGEGIPLVAGFNWAYDLTPVKNDPINADNIAYVSHPYPQKRKKPWEAQWAADWGYIKENYPLILTEIGFCGPEDPGAHVPVISDESYGDAITDYADSRGISYVLWVFDTQWAPRLITDWKYTPSRHGSYFKEHFKTYGKKD